MITKNKLFISLGTAVLFLVFNFCFISPIQAYDELSCINDGGKWNSVLNICDFTQGILDNPTNNTTGVQTANSTAGNVNEGVKLNDPLHLDTTHPLGDLANRVIKTALGISGVLALLAFIYAGIIWMIPFGDQTGNIKKGKQMMIWAVLGLVVIFGSYAILTFITGALGLTK